MPAVSPSGVMTRARWEPVRCMSARASSTSSSSRTLASDRTRVSGIGSSYPDGPTVRTSFRCR